VLLVMASPNDGAPLRCGDRVICLWSDDMYHSGIVADVVSPAGVYSVLYDDGSLEHSVPAHALRKQPTLAPVAAQAGKASAKSKAKQRLRDAANAGDADTVVRCLEDGVPSRFFDRQGYTPLHWAAGPEDGMQADTPDRQRCIAALASTSDLNALDKTPQGMRAIDHAVRHNLSGCVSVLVERGASVAGAAHWAVTFHAYGALRALLQPQSAAAACGRSKACEGCTPLMLSCRNGDARALRILLDSAAAGGGSTVRDAVVAAQAGEDRLTPLHFAVYAGSPMCVRLLLAHGADPSQICAKGEHALALAQRRVTKPPGGADAEFDGAGQCEELLLSAVATAAACEGGKLVREGVLAAAATSAKFGTAAAATNAKFGMVDRSLKGSGGHASVGVPKARKRKPQGEQAAGVDASSRAGGRRIQRTSGEKPLAATWGGGSEAAGRGGGGSWSMSAVIALGVEAGGEDPLSLGLPPLMDAFQFGAGIMSGGMLGACVGLDGLRHSAGSPFGCSPCSNVTSSPLAGSPAATSPLARRPVGIPGGACGELPRGDEMLGDVLGDVQGLESAWEER
jgi:ankyrin repeat protein